MDGQQRPRRRSSRVHLQALDLTVTAEQLGGSDLLLALAVDDALWCLWRDDWQRRCPHRWHGRARRRWDAEGRRLDADRIALRRRLADSTR